MSSSTNQTEWMQILEAALHAHISSRCHRAYRHDLRNALQGIYGGFDALTRLLRTPATGAQIDRTIDFTKQAITGHEQSLERVLNSIVVIEQAPEVTDACALLQDLGRFLTNDAALNRVRLCKVRTEPAKVLLRPQKLRLALLSLMIDAIDAMPQGGELLLSCGLIDGAPLIELSDTRTSPAAQDPWQLDLTTTPAYRGWTMYVVRQLILGENGTLTCEPRTAGGRIIRIALPALDDFAAS